MATTTISPAAAEALRGATMTDTTLTLPQVTPTVYAELKKVIQRTGGAWVRKLGTHVYPTDPRPIIAEVLGTGAMPVDEDKIAAFFRTPEDLAERLACAAGVLGDMRVLEPSAGDGAIADVIARQYRDSAHTLDLVCVEPDRRRFDALVAKGHDARMGTFEDYAAANPGAGFDAIVMNPPFATPGSPVLWAEHVLLAWDLLSDGGTLAAIVPNNIERQHKTVAKVRDLVDLWGWVEDIPDDAFKASGTLVRTKMLMLARS